MLKVGEESTECVLFPRLFNLASNKLSTVSDCYVEIESRGGLGQCLLKGPYVSRGVRLCVFVEYSF